MEGIKCEKLIFSYPDTDGAVFGPVDFEVGRGELCLLIGESAVGKSTLLRLLKIEIAPFGKVDGSISVNGTVGYVAQNVEESIISDRVYSELSFGIANMGKTGEEIDLLVAETASYFNLEDKLDRDIASLSGGEKQILNLASVMIMRPDILILDEPTSQLDPVSSTRFVNMILRLHNDFGTTVIMSSHDTDDIIRSVDSVAYLAKDGSITKLPTSDMVRHLVDIGDPMSQVFPVDLRYDMPSVLSHIHSLTAPVCDDAIALKARNICFAYDRGIDVLRGVDLNVYHGKINAVLGPNSGGKTTLLKVLAGVKKPYRGRVKTDLSVSCLSQNVYDMFIREKCSDEVAFGDVTDYLGIDYIRDMHPYDLSGGEAQRLALAKVLSMGADILLLDEPTKGFDPVLKIRLANLLRDLCENGKTILIVSHDIEFVGEYADYVSFLSLGRIIHTAKRRDFFSSLGFYTTRVARLTSGVADGVVSVPDLREAGAEL